MVDRLDKVQSFVLAPEIEKRTRAMKEGFNSFRGYVFLWDSSNSG